LPQIDLNIVYPSRRYLPAKVRTFIDHLVEHFSKTPNSVLGEQWAKNDPYSSARELALIEAASSPAAFDGEEEADEIEAKLPPADVPKRQSQRSALRQSS
jgi:hypothetical protein